MYDYLCQAYELHSDIARDKVIRDRLPDCLVLLNEEAVWQQIVYRNREEAKHRRYFEELLSVPVGDFMRKSHVVSGINKPKFIDDEEECVNEVEEMKEDGEASDFDGEDREFEQVDLFNLKDENLKDLENELENADEEEDEGERNAEDVKLSEKVMTGKRRKTEVDDRFFKLSEMEEFLDNEEKSGESEGFFDDINDEENGTEANYYYSEFFDPVSDGPMSLERSSADGKRKWPETTRKNEKKVRFEDEESAEESEEREEEEEEKTSDGENSRVNDDRVLFGTIDNNEKKTGFQLRQEKLREKIQAIEKSNLASRNWDLSGEVTAVDREENTMLEKYVDFEQIGRTAVAITPDVTAMIEGLIIQRIKDKAFDDVEKKFRQTEVQKEFRVPAIDEIKKQSLAEVYEEEYQKSRNEGPSSTPSVRQDVEEIGSLIADLFSKLDALSHYQYAPKAVRPEIQIINNMPALQKEEVGPVTSTYEVLLAPEEVKKHISGEMKGKEERDKTDRNRERRKKKKLQHDRRIKNERTNVGNDAENGQVDAGRKTKLKPKKSIQKNKTVAHETIKSSKFFAKLQETMSAEVAGKSMSGREKRKQKTSNPSSKYIL
ncbi:hypothetical protein AB6A40_005703 [Gnathostoma spinigerum]|uniref:U3 small nucleolar ribonucleoprotein protein MPP10 n=1 Tax=Gnathostoma spinigerum TaxID=75299 RepID=A0ABD6ENV6_9BILA